MTVIINGTTGVTSVNGTAAAPSVTGTDTDTGIVYGTNTLSLATGGTTAMTIDSSQNMGVGTTSPSVKLTVVGNIKAGYEAATGIVFGLAPSGVPSNNVNAYVLWGDAASFGGQNGDLIYVPRTSTNAAHRFYTGNGGAATEKVTITNSGVLDLATGSGAVGQIQFPATQVASSNANTLDDYEEGTWTPVDNSGAGLSFSVATGFYTKIGRLVVASGQVQWPSTANGVSAAVSLPFASASTTANYSAGSALNSANLTLTSFVTSNVSYVSFYKQPLGTFTQATNANLSTQYIYFTVTYFTA